MPQKLITTFDLIRHGEPVGGRKYRGQTDDPLSEIHGGKHLLIIAHAGVIRMMVAHVLDIPLQHLFRLQVANASLTRIRVEKRGEHLFPQLVFHGGSL